MCVSLPSSNIFFSFQLPSISHLAYTAKRVTSALVTSETYRSSIIFFPLPPYSYHCGLEVTFSLYTDLIHVQVVFAVQTATRLGTVREMALFKRGKSYLDFFAPARVFIHSFAFIQGGFTSSPSCMRSFMEVLLALHLRSLILLLRVHESGNSSRICHPLDR